MIPSVSERIIEKFAKENVVDFNDKDLYTFGLRQGLLMVINLVTTLAIGLVFKMLWQSVIFMLAYIPIRTYAGGYHAKTQLRCYLLSIVTIVAVLLVIKLIPWSGFICTVMTLIASTSIIILAPVEDSNKPLDQTEKAVYKKRAYIILIILVLTALLAWFVGLSFVSVSIIAALFVLAVMLVLGKLKNILKEIELCLKKL